MIGRLFFVLLGALAVNAGIVRHTTAAEPAITKYGERHPQAPEELARFSFLVGEWSGSGRTRLADGTHVEWEGAKWIGRYFMNGTAIMDELHAPGPDGKLYLGITFRHFDTQRDSWIIEFLNVPGSFLRRQVNPQAGSVTLDAGTIVITCDDEDPQTKIRESYRVVDQNHFTYTMATSRDGGRTWGPVSVEMTMSRVD